MYQTMEMNVKTEDGECSQTVHFDTEEVRRILSLMVGLRNLVDKLEADCGKSFSDKRYGTPNPVEDGSGDYRNHNDILLIEKESVVRTLSHSIDTEMTFESRSSFLRILNDVFDGFIKCTIAAEISPGNTCLVQLGSKEDLSAFYDLVQITSLNNQQENSRFLPASDDGSGENVNVSHTLDSSHDMMYDTPMTVEKLPTQSHEDVALEVGTEYAVNNPNHTDFRQVCEALGTSILTESDIKSEIETDVVGSDITVTEIGSEGAHKGLYGTRVLCVSPISINDSIRLLESLSNSINNADSDDNDRSSLVSSSHTVAEFLGDDENEDETNGITDDDSEDNVDAKREDPDFNCDDTAAEDSSSDSSSHDIEPPELETSCSVCEETFSSQQSLEEHMATMHSDNQPRFKCNFCDAAFHTARSQIVHEHTHKRMSREFLCLDCGEVCVGLFNFRRHGWKHTRPFHCNKCGNTFAKKEILDGHLLSHMSPSLRKHACSTCEFRFHSKSALKRHSRKHDAKRKRDFVCERCGDGFDTNAGLLRHIREVHDNFRPFICEWCNKAFANKTNLRVHVASHMRRIVSSKRGEYES